jgi:RNA polymerase sigma factor (sigma-70 family)
MILSKRSCNICLREQQVLPMPPSEQARWFIEQIQPHEAVLRAYLSRRFPSLPDHDDLVQETYVKVLRAKESGYLTHVKGFLFAAARNAALDRFRRQQKHPQEELAVLESTPALEESPGVVDLLERRHRQDALRLAISSLPERCQHVMRMRYINGRNVKEIAESIGISEFTVKGHLVKGIKDCTLYFVRHGLIDRAATTTALP